MERVMGNLRNDAVRGPSLGQTTLRRLLSGATPDNQLTPDTRVGRTSISRSVSARGASPVKNSYFRNPTEEQFRSPLDAFAKDGEDTRIPAGSSNLDGVREREVESRLDISEDDGDDGKASPTNIEDKRKHQNKSEDLGPEGDGSVYLPGDFRYLYSTSSPTQDPREGSAQNIESAYDTHYSRRFDPETFTGGAETRRHHNELFYRYDGNRSVRDDPGWRVSGNYPVTPGIVPERFREGRESVSVIKNVTKRESKRPKARANDHEYTRRSSMSPPMAPLVAYRSPDHSQPVERFGIQRSDQTEKGDFGITISDGDILAENNCDKHKYQQQSNYRPTITPTTVVQAKHVTPGMNREGFQHSRAGHHQFQDADVFKITLTHEGMSRVHEVDRYLPVRQLVSDAATIFRINSDDIILMLFGMVPHTLDRNNRISDPPRIGPGAIVLVFCVPGGVKISGGQGTPGGPAQRSDTTQPFSIPLAGGFGGSKILGTFKLPKFDGNARQWKAWDKTFIRYLSIHQLDFVIEETFLDILPLTPHNFGANKMVDYILEDAITPGSLAAKYFRQAAKWNGNYIMGMYFPAHNVWRQTPQIGRQ